MTYSYTGIIYFFGALAMASLVWRTAKIFKRQKTEFTKFLLYSFISFLVFFVFGTIDGLFLVNSLSLIFITILFCLLFQSLGVIFLINAFYPIIFPKIPLRLIQGVIVLLTVIVEILYFSYQIPPFLDSEGFLNYPMPISVQILRTIIFSSVVVPAFIIFFRQLRSEIKEVRRKAIFFSILFGMALFFTIIFFIIFKGSGVTEAAGIFFVILVVAFLNIFTREQVT